MFFFRSLKVGDEGGMTDDVLQKVGVHLLFFSLVRGTQVSQEEYHHYPMKAFVVIKFFDLLIYSCKTRLPPLQLNVKRLAKICCFSWDNFLLGILICLFCYREAKRSQKVLQVLMKFSLINKSLPIWYVVELNNVIILVFGLALIVDNQNWKSRRKGNALIPFIFKPCNLLRIVVYTKNRFDLCVGFAQCKQSWNFGLGPSCSRHVASSHRCHIENCFFIF